VLSSDFEEQLNEAFCTRPGIEQAKGVLAALRHCVPQQAFEEISLVSQRHHLRLSELAAALVDAAADRTPEDPLARAVVWVEWGSLFPMLTAD
jgi:AmiR/NasT family two-component response regulator